MKGKIVISVFVIVVTAILATNLQLIEGFAQGTSECDKSPFCVVVSPSDSGSYTAPGNITQFVIKTGASAEDQKIVFTPPGGIDPNSCWEVEITGPFVEWDRLANSSICQDPSAFEVWWNEEPTPTQPTPEHTPTQPHTSTPTEPTDPTPTTTKPPDQTPTQQDTPVPQNTPTPTEPPPGGIAIRNTTNQMLIFGSISLAILLGGGIAIKMGKRKF